MQIAQAQVFESMACVLATFDITPAKDEAGNELMPETKSIDGLIKYAARLLVYRAV